MWTGSEALDLGLVDETGGFREALRKARELGGSRTGRTRGASQGQPAPRRASVFRESPRRAAFDAIGETWRALSELRAGGALALAPYEISED